MNLELVFNVLGSSVFVSSYFICSGKRLFKEKMPRKISSIFIGLFLFAFGFVNYLIIDNVVKTGTLYIAVLITYRLLFNKPILQCAIAALVSYIGIAIGEVLFITSISILNVVGVLPNITNFSGDALANLIIISFATLFILLIYRLVNKFLNKIREYNKVTLIITFALLLIAICALFYKLYYHNYELDSYLTFNLVLVLALAYIALVVIKQHYDKAKLSDEYEKYVEYSKQSEKLVDQYSISQHENKNELIIIRSMVHKNNSKLLEYLDEIIASKDNISESWIRHLRYLPFGGLKGIIHNKISEMKDNKINVYLNISKKIGKCHLKNLTIKENNQLSKIIGVFLDNAMEAAINSQDKEVSICAYVENNDVVFEISNTYVGELDLSKISNVGVTTKGKGRGYGLTLVDSILNENKMFKNETKKVDNYFVQILKINI